MKWRTTAYRIGTDSFTVTVEAEPTVEAGDAANVVARDNFVRAASITDPDSTDWEVEVDFGDFSPIVEFTANNPNFNLMHVFDKAGTFTATVTVEDESGNEATDTFDVTVTAPAATIVGRGIFYNNWAFDGNDPAPNVLDDLAIATDKSALLPGETATFAN